MKDNVQVILDVFRAIEQRDVETLVDLEHPEIELTWPPPLPFAGTFKGLKSMLERDPSETWHGVWIPLQPTEHERNMDPRVIGAIGDEVVIHYRQRALDAAGEQLDEPVIGLYKVLDGKLAKAQMFYFNPVAITDYLRRAKRPAS